MDTDSDGVVMHDATDDDAYAEGDPTLDEIDVEAVTHLAAQFSAAQQHPEGAERNFAVLGVLHELYGDDLVVL